MVWNRIEGVQEASHADSSILIGSVHNVEDEVLRLCKVHEPNGDR
jgi:hypothetical protein